MQPDTIIPDPANPQAFNRYSYVVNNPILFNDPSGHYPTNCGPDNIYCGGLAENDYYSQTRLGGNDDGGNLGEGDDSDEQPEDILVDDLQAGGDAPPTCGQQGVYSPKCPDWHFYTTTYMVCPAEFECSTSEMKYYLLRYAYPGQDHSYPVVDNGIYPIRIVIPHTNYAFGLGFFPGRIRVSVSDDGMMSVNRTLPGHIFHDGIAIRKVYQGENGAWYVTTYSIGNNFQWHTAGVNNTFGPGIFDILDQEMRENIDAHH